MEMLKPDLCVIGGGPGGIALATATAALGAPTVLIERGRMGGAYLAAGIPARALAAAAARAHAVRTAGGLGIGTAPPEVDFAAVRAHVAAAAAAIAPDMAAERLAALGVTVLRESARFIDRRTVQAGAATIRARRFAIATGARPAMPDVPGLAGTPHFTTDTIFDLDALPRRLVVLGGDTHGVELAQSFRRLGSEVTIVSAEPALLAEFDPELAEEALVALEREGVRIATGCMPVAVAMQDGTIRVRIERNGQAGAIEADVLLVAAGRAPALADLGLDAAGIAQEAGGIRVGRGLRTSNRRVLALGEAAGRPPFAHLAMDDAGLAARGILFRLPALRHCRHIMRIAHTDPEIAWVGPGEDAVRARAGGRFRVLRAPFHDNGRAQAEGNACGHVKLVADARGRLMAAGIVGPQAGELITPYMTAVAGHTDLAALARHIHPQTSLAETGRRAAGTILAERLTRAPIGSIIERLRRFG